MKIHVTGLRGIPGVMGGVESHCEELMPRIKARNADLDITILCRAPYVPEGPKSYRGLALQPLPSLGHHSAAGLSNADGPFVTLNGPEMSSTRLLGAIERLEKRIHDLEHTSLLPHTVEAEIETIGSNTESVATLMAKGQALLSANEPDKALACFEEVLKADPQHAEALVKKGTALEQLKRLEEAIDCYDKAIASNQAMTVAYLHKGAVYNQLERFSEALECYEQALRTQQKAVNS